MKHIFIINPHAGKKDQTARLYNMADRLRNEHGLDCACMLTDRPGGATDMARKLAESGEEIICKMVERMNMPHVVEQLRKLEAYGLENEQKYPWMPAAWNRNH